MSRPAAVGGVTTDIFKGTALLAAWTCLWRGGKLNGVTAFKTLPERIKILGLGCL